MYFYVRPLQLLPKPSEARGSEQVWLAVNMHECIQKVEKGHFWPDSVSRRGHCQLVS